MSDSSPPDLDPDRHDHLVVALKGAVGAIPILGNLVAELLGATIPRQRLDRIADFVEQLHKYLEDFQGQLADRVKADEELAGLLEDALRQAASSTSQDRRTYLAELVSRSVTSQEIEHNESRYLLRLFGELSDLEVLWLRYIDTHDLNLHNRNVSLFSQKQPLSPKRALQDSYKNHLVQLGLLELSDPDANTPRAPTLVAEPPRKRTAHRTTMLGKLLLRKIGQHL